MTIACSDCGTLQDLPPLTRRSVATCPTCRNRMESRSGRNLTVALITASATFALLIPANLLPLLRVSVLGMTRESWIGSGVHALWNHQWVIVALLVAALVIVLPLLRFALLTLTLGVVRTGGRTAWLGRVF